MKTKKKVTIKTFLLGLVFLYCCWFGGMMINRLIFYKTYFVLTIFVVFFIIFFIFAVKTLFESLETVTL